MDVTTKVNSKIIFLCFLIATTATLGSLFFSEVMQFIPCNMCWYQRIFMYPLVFIFLINLLYPDDKVFKYAFTLVFIGLLISIYHNLLMFGIIPESAVPCANGVPCSTEYINWLGFITIPFLSMVSYLAIFILLISMKK
ncbi:disulfide oxidoreductase [Arcobacter arenosus]|jgi:disulfide bond formation protein DsbB|uniref:Disulfide bond formation protein B n=1 Tax=Arcobacter arenosus TaxID=2576037 RepID=A0A5R8Y3W9_9BACT|nr:disulfide oxidoreductase [Arcobacter arenosus]TLP40766.1 disulfide bond formation protein B [Arcobacter arenosus]